MSDENSYGWLSFFKKIIDFFGYLIAFFIGRKEVSQEKEKENFDKKVTDLKNSYNQIDKDKEAQGKDDLNKRLNNMF